MDKNIKAKLIEMIIQNARKNISSEDIKEKTLLIEDLEYDSINLIELMVQIEQEFDIEFLSTEMVIDNINCFGSLLTFISKQVQGVKVE